MNIDDMITQVRALQVEVGKKAMTSKAMVHAAKKIKSLIGCLEAAKLEK